MSIFNGNFIFKVDGESVTKEEVKDLIHSNMTVTVDNFCVNFVSPKKSLKQDAKLSLDELKAYMLNDNSVEKDLTDVIYLINAENKETLGQRFAEIKLKNVEKEENSAPKKDKIAKLLEEADKHQEQNGGRVTNMEFPFDAILTPTREECGRNGRYFDREAREKKVIEDWNRIDLDGLKNNKYLGQPAQVGKKESQTVKKAPIFTYCKQMKNAIEALSLRSLYGHEKYEKGDDWENFSRVENGEFEYANASFRHALGIGEEDEKNHLIAEAWNAVAKLEIYLRKSLEVSK